MKKAFASFGWFILIVLGIAINQYPEYDLTFELSIGLSLAIIGAIGLIKRIF